MVLKKEDFHIGRKVFLKWLGSEKGCDVGEIISVGRKWAEISSGNDIYRVDLTDDYFMNIGRYIDKRGFSRGILFFKKEDAEISTDNFVSQKEVKSTLSIVEYHLSKLYKSTSAYSSRSKKFKNKMENILIDLFDIM